MIRKNHFALTKPRYIKGTLTGVYNTAWSPRLWLKEIDATYENLEPLMAKLSEKWHWNQQDRYTEELLKEKLSQEGTRLFLLEDSGEPIGYAMVSRPPRSIIDRFWEASNDIKALEIDNLGLFPGYEGGGRGKKYFEMIFDQTFQEYDLVYWSQHETHSPTLRQFYQDKMGMSLLGYDCVPDFRPKPKVA